MSHRAAISVVAFTGCAIALCHGATIRAAEIPWKIDEPTAQILAAEGVGDRLNADDFDYQGSGMSPPFFAFDVLSRPPAEGSFGFFAVNPWTGDVWALWGCDELSTPALRKSQAAIKRRFTRAELKQYAQLRRLEPDCTVDTRKDRH
jgi:hypothetical protein